MALARVLLLALAVAAAAGTVQAHLPEAPPSKNFTDTDYFQLTLNLAYVGAEFYCYSYYGYGIERLPDPDGGDISGGGPKSIGGKKANLTPKIRSVAQQLCLEEIDHIAILHEYLENDTISRPLIDIGSSWPALFRAAYDNRTPINFDPYQDNLSWLLASYFLPYLSVTALVGANEHLTNVTSKRLLAGTLGVKASQDTLIRTYLYTLEGQSFHGRSVSSVTAHISQLRNKLAGTGRVADEALRVPLAYGAGKSIYDNIIQANHDSLTYARNPPETLGIVYGTANASKAGGLLPNGASGVIGQYYLQHKE